MAEPKIHFAKTSDGVDIAYCVAGSGHPIVWAAFEDRGERELNGVGHAVRVLAMRPV